MKRILVIEGGNVLVGDLSPNTTEFGLLEVQNTAVVRRWGTTRGLGELAAQGPTANTQLDPCGTAHVNPNKLLFSLIVTYEGPWV